MTRTFALLAAVVGLALVANPAYLFPHAGETAFRYDARPASPDGGPDGVERLAFEDLSTVARDRFERALESNDALTVYGDDGQLPEFRDAATAAGREFVVERGDDAYLFTVRVSRDENALLVRIGQAALAALGVTLAAAGWWSRRGSDRRRRRYVAFFCALAAVLVAFGAAATGDVGVLAWTATAAATAVVAPAAGVWAFTPRRAG